VIFDFRFKNTFGIGMSSFSVQYVVGMLYVGIVR